MSDISKAELRAELTELHDELTSLRELEAYAETVYPEVIADLKAELAEASAWLRDAEELPGWGSYMLDTSTADAWSDNNPF